jgi:hypothetical protein
VLKKRTLAAGAAAVGVALIVGALLAPSAGAQQEALTIFGANAVARGIEVTGTPKPFIIDPIASVATPFARTVMNSLPESHSLASALFPGDLASSVINEGGTIYNESQGQLFYPLALEADSSAPNTQDRTRTIAGLPTAEGGLTADGIYLRAVAKPEQNDSTATMHRVVLQPQGQANPVVEIDAITVATRADKASDRVGQVSTARAQGLELLGGMIKIGSIVSTARVVSNGTEVTEKSGTVQISGVELIDSEGKPHRARIDNEGIHLEDPSLPPGANKDLSNVVKYLLGRAGITISLLQNTTVVEGAAGDAFAGGLLIDLDSGPCEICLGTILGQLPPEVAQALSQISDPISSQKICPSDINPGLSAVPICVTTGLIPTSPQLVGTITIASAGANVSGALENVPSVGGGVESGGGGEVSGGAEIPGSSFVPGTEGGEVSTGGGTSTGGPAGALTGLASEMPDPLLAALGVIFLLIAMGLLVGPSFRRQT